MTVEYFNRDDILEMLRVQSAGDEAWTNDALGLIDSWIERGDGCAVYRNEDLGHAGMGNLKLVSFGGAAAQLPTSSAGGPFHTTPPSRLPDIGDQINWRYVLIGTYQEGRNRGNRS